MGGSTGDAASEVESSQHRIDYCSIFSPPSVRRMHSDPVVPIQSAEGPDEVFRTSSSRTASVDSSVSSETVTSIPEDILALQPVHVPAPANDTNTENCATEALPSEGLTCASLSVSYILL